MFWSVKSQVFTAELESGRWNSPKIILADREVHYAWAGASSDGLVFMAADRGKNGAYELQLFLERNRVPGRQRLAYDCQQKCWESAGLGNGGVVLD